MMRRVVCAALLSVVAYAFTGCSFFMAPRTVAHLDNETEPFMVEAPLTDEYALYKGLAVTPLAEVFIEKGDRLGFRIADDGTYFAVAGDTEIPVQADENYYWQRR